MNNTVNITIDIFLMALTALASFVALAGMKLDKKNNSHFLVIFICNFWAVFFNMMGLIYKGNMGPGVHNLLVFFNFCEFVFSLLLPFSFIFYFLGLIGAKQYNWIYTFLGLGLIFLVINLFTGGIYYINDQNRYTRGYWYIWYMAFIGLAFVMDFILILINRKKISVKRFAYMTSYVFLPVVVMIAQVYIYGVYIILITSTSMLILTYISVLFDEVKASIENQKQLSEIKSQVFLAQVQPHFIYNCLTAIMAIKGNPQETKDALKSFSDYLRGSMDTLSSNDPIPFNQELDFIQNYVSLEKLRFGDKINVVYDCQATDFLVQPLTIQMLVENAIKHGISPKRNGGNVCIITRKDDNKITVEVKDDGLGFDTSEAIQKGHFGLGIVEERIKKEKGNIKVDSEVNKGTDVVIELARGESI